MKLVVSSYTNFKNLAHKPKGIVNKNAITFNNKTINSSLLYNPAFIFHNKEYNYFYVCLESINEGNIITIDSSLNILNNVSSNGKSSCYLEYDNNKNIININYWDSSFSIHSIKNGILQDSIYTYREPQKIICKTLTDHLTNRQSECHFHSALFYKDVLFIPDLGLDKIHIFNSNNYNKISEYQLPKNSGPRYIRKMNNLIFIINELSSTISMCKYIDNFEIIQTISTIPENYKDYNTCGNLLVHPSNKYIFASNRGHNSIAIYKLNNKLELINIFNCGGKTPRHFTFNKNGDKVFVANQDTNNISIFNFNNNNLIFSHNIKINSPNYILSLT